MSALLLLLLATAWAEDGPIASEDPPGELAAAQPASDSSATTVWTVGLGGEISLNDPYLVSRGVRLSIGVQPWSWMSVALTGVLLPQGGDNLKYLRSSLLEDANIRPDWSPMYFRSQLAVSAWPLQSKGERWSAAVGPVVGMGVVHTVDDADALAVSPDEPLYAATARQWHPASTLGLAARAQQGRLGMTVQLARIAYVEQVYSRVEEQKRPWMASVEVAARLW